MAVSLMNSPLPEKTLENLNSLPLLPLPDLNQTCQKYLQSVKPYLSAEELERTEEVVKKFQNGVGINLQEKLLKKASTTKNWLEDIWLQTYQKYRGPLPFISNIGGYTLYDDKDFFKTGMQIRSAASTLYGYVKVYQELFRQEFPVTKLRKKIPLDMTQYYKVFCSARLPGFEMDVPLHYFLKDGQIKVYKHVVVLIRSRFYLLDVLDDSLQPLMMDELERQLYRIKALSEKTEQGPPMGVFTALPRPKWKKVQDHLFKLDTNNEKFVDLINKAIVLLSIDDEMPTTRNEVLKCCLGGKCENRWFDKGIQLVIYRNGISAFHGDHIHCEGTVPSYISEKAEEHVEYYKTHLKDHGWIRTLKEPKEFQFIIDDDIRSLFPTALQEYQELSDSIIAVDLPFTLFGREFPKSQKIHPDSFIQMAIQLTYFRIHKKCCPTYQTATTRQFYHARTETVRSCTVESVAWTKAMDDNSVGTTRKRALLEEACKMHHEMTHQANEGQGIDRHLLALYLLSLEEGIEMPEMYTDKAWHASGSDGGFVLSSSVSSMGAPHGGIAPIVENGYGVFYTLGNNRFELVVVTYTVSSETNAEKFMDIFHQSLEDMQNLIVTQSKM